MTSENDIENNKMKYYIWSESIYVGAESHELVLSHAVKQPEFITCLTYKNLSATAVTKYTANLSLRWCRVAHDVMTSHTRSHVFLQVQDRGNFEVCSRFKKDFILMKRWKTTASKSLTFLKSVNGSRLEASIALLKSCN